MAFRLVGGFPDNFTVQATVTSGTAIAAGDLLAISGNVLARATSSSSIHTIFAVAAETISTTATLINVIPVCQGQLWEADSNANSATTQRYESMALTNHATIDNSDTDVTGPTGVFFCTHVVGAAADKRILGEFCRLQSTST